MILVLRAVVAFTFIAAPLDHSQAIGREMPHYDVGARFVPETGLVTANVQVSLPAVQAGQIVEFLLGQSFDIQSLGVDQPGARVEVSPTEQPWPGLQKITVAFKQEAKYPVVRFHYLGPPNPTGKLPINLISPAHIEMSFDSMWLPTLGDTNTDFSVHARLAGIPADASFVSQGRARRAGEEIRVRRTVGQIDFAFVAVPGLKAARDGSVEVYARNLNSTRAGLYQKHATGSVRFLEQLLGTLHSKPVRLAIVPRERTSGYARKGYIVVTETGDKAERDIAGEVAHELAHSWFSNANPASEDRWLDESIASYAQLRYEEHLFGKAHLDELLASLRKQSIDALPVLGGVRSGLELYSKGPVLLVDLERRIGRTKMNSLIRVVAEKKIAVTADFLTELTKLVSSEEALRFERSLRT